jgi:hypothetical protein
VAERLDEYSQYVTLQASCYYQAYHMHYVGVAQMESIITRDYCLCGRWSVSSSWFLHAEDEKFELSKQAHPAVIDYLNGKTGSATRQNAGELATANAAVSVVLDVIKRKLGRDRGETHPLYIELRRALTGPRLTADRAEGVETTYSMVKIIRINPRYRIIDNMHLYKSDWF